MTSIGLTDLKDAQVQPWCFGPYMNGCVGIELGVNRLYLHGTPGEIRRFLDKVAEALPPALEVGEPPAVIYSEPPMVDLPDSGASEDELEQARR